MEKNKQIAVAQMRDLVQELGYTAKREGDETLLRFLVARSMNPKDAAKMFVEWIKWRGAFVPLGHIPENEIPDQLQARKIMLNGPNGHGCPILIVQACKHFPHKDRLQLKKFVVHALDKAIASGFKEREVGNEKLIGVIDLQKMSYKNIDARALITGFQYLQAYYPERLSKCYMLNMPWIFVSVWNMISRFLDQATLDKVIIVKNEEEMKGFAKEIGEEWLPEEYCGRAKLVPIQDVKLNHWPLP